MVINKFRLHSKTYDRDTPKILPAKIFFLSVEGNLTEREYFENISRFREEIGVNVKVHVSVLRRSDKDTLSAPKHVLELLEEYLSLRKNSLSHIEQALIEEFKGKYDEDSIRKFIYDKVNNESKEYANFLSNLKLLNFDLEYIKFLTTYNTDLDEYVVIIDRDKKSHSVKNMMDLIEHCKHKGYLCYISNPCFEFWLLMHLKDIEKDYKAKYDEILENATAKDSKRHTFVSKEVSKIAGHGKSGIRFEKNYLTKIDFAIEQSEKFPSENDLLILEIGSNIGELIKKMRNSKI